MQRRASLVLLLSEYLMDHEISHKMPHIPRYFVYIVDNQNQLMNWKQKWTSLHCTYKLHSYYQWLQFSRFLICTVFLHTLMTIVVELTEIYFFFSYLNTSSYPLVLLRLRTPTFLRAVSLLSNWSGGVFYSYDFWKAVLWQSFNIISPCSTCR